MDDDEGGGTGADFSMGKDCAMMPNASAHDSTAQWAASAVIANSSSNRLFKRANTMDCGIPEEASSRSSATRFLRALTSTKISRLYCPQ